MKSLSMRSSRRRAQSGFTLVEIAIVLVIIGLLLGGVLKGQELIENGRVKSAAADMNGISAAYNSYLDRYRRLPGDDGPTLAVLTARGGSWTTITALAITMVWWLSRRVRPLTAMVSRRPSSSTCVLRVSSRAIPLIRVPMPSSERVGRPLGYCQRSSAGAYGGALAGVLRQCAWQGGGGSRHPAG